MQTRHLAQRPRRHLPTNSGVFVTESALKREEDVSTAFHVIREFSKHCVACNVKRRDEDHLIVRKICTLREDEVQAHIGTIQRTVHLPKDGVVVHTIAELHEFYAVVGVVAVKDGNLVFALNISDFRAYPLKFMRCAADFIVGATRYEVVSQHSLPVSLL